MMIQCYRCVRKDIVGLCDEGGDRPELQPACKAHAGTLIEEAIRSLTGAQKAVLLGAVESPTTHSGRGGHSASTMRALERKGLVKQGKAPATWRFTDGAAFIGRCLERTKLDETCRAKTTAELVSWFPDSRGQAAELEVRGWRWDPTSADWVRAHHPAWAVVEGIAGIYSYHVRDASQRGADTLPAACGTKVMVTGIPLAAWGLKSHIPSCYCAVCAARAALPSKNRTT